MTADPYKTMNLKRTATPEEIRAAYISLAKIHHPDAGGDPEDFKRLQAAFDLLSDPEKRGLYDATGCVRGDPESDNKILAFQNLCNIWGELVLQIPANELPYVDIVDTIRRTLFDALSKYERELAQLQDDEVKLKKAQEVIEKKLKRKKKPTENLFTMVIKRRLEENLIGRQPVEKKLAVVRVAIELINDYEFEVEQMMRFQRQTTTMPGYFTI